MNCNLLNCNLLLQLYLTVFLYLGRLTNRCGPAMRLVEPLSLDKRLGEAANWQRVTHNLCSPTPPNVAHFNQLLHPLQTPKKSEFILSSNSVLRKGVAALPPSLIWSRSKWEAVKLAVHCKLSSCCRWWSSPRRLLVLFILLRSPSLGIESYFLSFLYVCTYAFHPAGPHTTLQTFCLRESIHGQGFLHNSPQFQTSAISLYQESSSFANISLSGLFQTISSME